MTQSIATALNNLILTFSIYGVSFKSKRDRASLTIPKHATRTVIILLCGHEVNCDKYYYDIIL